MDRKLLDLLVCPVTRQPLHLLGTADLATLNAAIAEGSIRRADGTTQGEPVTAALITRDRKTMYRIDDDIPVLLPEEAIASGQIAGFIRE